MTPQELPSRKRLKELLEYNASTGVFRWISRTSNRIRIGDIADCHDLAGYIVIRIDGRLYKAHRLAWLYHYGSAPPAYIDHIDMNKSNNRIDNLRLANKSQNQANTRVRQDSQTGVKGVHFDTERNSYQVKIRRKHLGRFETLSAAVEAYEQAAKHLFGVYART